MHITEYGAEHARTLLFLPCTAEPVWAFSATVALLARRWHVFQVSYDGHEPAYPGDFLSVEQTVAEIMLWLLLARDCIGFRLVTRSRGILEAAFPPERFTLPGHDPKAEYDALQAYLRTYSRRTVRNVFWSGNNYALPRTPAETGTKITYWYGDDEKKDRRGNIRFIKRYFPHIRVRGIPKMAHAELVMIHPEEFCHYADKFLLSGAGESRGEV